MQPLRVLETCLYVDDLPAAKAFYTEVLGLALVSEEENRHVFMRCADGMVLLFNPLSTRDDDEVPHGAIGSGHMAFAVENDDLAVWRQRLADQHVTIEHEKVRPPDGRSIYFRDPAGNSLEFATPRIWG